MGPKFTFWTELFLFNSRLFVRTSSSHSKFYISVSVLLRAIKFPPKASRSINLQLSHPTKVHIILSQYLEHVRQRYPMSPRWLLDLLESALLNSELPSSPSIMTKLGVRKQPPHGAPTPLQPYFDSTEDMLEYYFSSLQPPSFYHVPKTVWLSLRCGCRETTRVPVRITPNSEMKRSLAVVDCHSILWLTTNLLSDIFEQSWNKALMTFLSPRPPQNPSPAAGKSFFETEVEGGQL